MIVVVAGLLTAVLWAIGPLTSSRATRRIGSSSTLALVALIGLVVTLPLLFTDRLPTALGEVLGIGIATLGITGVTLLRT